MLFRSVVDKESVLDVKTIADDQRIFDIKIQNIPEHFYINRSLYYWSRLYHGQLGKGQEYIKLRSVICINNKYARYIIDYSLSLKNFSYDELNKYALFKEVIYNQLHQLEKFNYVRVDNIPGFQEYEKTTCKPLSCPNR